jgi:hypothetical protein
MYSDSCDSSSPHVQIEVILDGRPVSLPPHRKSPAAIRSFLESLALEQQRVLWSFSVDGDAESSAGVLSAPGQFLRVIGQSITLEQMPLRLVENSIQQTSQVHAQVQEAVTRVLINEARYAHEIWWSITRELKQPLMTLSLLPDDTCGNTRGTSLMQLRRWQLQQLACVIKDVDLACQSADPTALSDALETRVLPWLEGLQESLDLLRHTVLAAHDLAEQDALHAGKGVGKSEFPA